MTLTSQQKEGRGCESLRREKKLMKLEQDHPLQNIVINAYKETIQAHDVSSLFPFFTKATVLSGPPMYVESLERSITPRETADAYRIVIQEVLNYMENAGHLYRDNQGWYLLKK